MRLGCPKIVLDHVCVLYVYIYMCVCVCVFVRTTMLKYMLYWRYMNWGCTSNQNTSSSWCPKIVLDQCMGVYVYIHSQKLDQVSCMIASYMIHTHGAIFHT